MLTGVVDHGVQVLAHTLEALEVPLDELLRLRVRDLQLPRERVRSLPVDRGEVDRLGAATHLRGDLFERHVEDECRSLAMNVATRVERVHERRIPGQMREQPKLDL